jgi:hypothetical protein
MTTLTTREQLEIAIHGSPQFHAKAASATGDLQPDQKADAHRELAEELTRLGTLLHKTAEYVQRGFPAKITLAQLAGDEKYDQDFTEKFASVIDEAGELVLRNHVFQTFQRKVREKTANVSTVSQKADASPSRIDGALERLRQLGQHVKK